MPKGYIIIHAVWGTKKRFPFLKRNLIQKIRKHIIENAQEKNIKIDRINGYSDHMHCLLRLNSTMSISKAMNLIKGESSHWINKQKLTEEMFEWADEYYAASVSVVLLNKVRKYIDRQEEHHIKNSKIIELEDSYQLGP